MPRKRWKRLSITLVATTTFLGLGIPGVVGQLAEANSLPKPGVSDLVATPSILYDSGGTVTLSADVTNATSCAFSSRPTVAGLPTNVPCSNGTVTEDVTVPANTKKTAARYRFELAAIGASTVRTKGVTVTVAPLLGAVRSITADGRGYCAVLNSGAVDCWGEGANGDLGNGRLYRKGGGYKDGSPVPVSVEGVAGIGTLTGVTNLTAAGTAVGGYCAIVTSGEVDCWGYGPYGELGNGSSSNSAVPVSVEGIGGVGTLTGVASLTGGDESYCAVLTSGEVACWGYDPYGELGNGSSNNSAVPVSVEGVGGTGTLTGVASLTGGGNSYCAVLTSGGVDCWGYGRYGELGNGEFYDTGNDASAFPVSVEGMDGTGTLTGVASLTISGSDVAYCAVLTSSGVDCWGNGPGGELGNGDFYTSSPYGSAFPVSVEGAKGIGTLTGVASLNGNGNGNGASLCAILVSGGVDCWGGGIEGNLGNGEFYTSSPYGSAFPVSVEGAKGIGTLTGVAGLTGDGYAGSCALLTSDGVECWGYGRFGALGNGKFYASDPYGGSAVPVKVLSAR
jgi:alpha-tubulin suppressor-like RCC1 family protein